MKLPVDIPELLKITTDLKEVASTPITVSIYIDDAASGELVGHVRSALASSGANAKVTIQYLTGDDVREGQADDMACIIAGDGKGIGKVAYLLRSARIPCMVVTTDTEAVAKQAEEEGFPIPEADIIAPVKVYSPTVLKIDQKLGGRLPFVNVAPTVEMADEDLDAEAFKILDTRMGQWIGVACEDKKLAFALAFPFVRKPLAMDCVSASSIQNAAVGFVPIIQGADMPIMTLNQAKMVLQIATIYGEPLDKDRIKELAAVVGGAFLFRNVARSIAKFVPFAGWAVSGAIGYAGTEAMGRAAIEYFEAGGDIVGLAQVIQTARDEATKGAAKVASSEAGSKIIAAVKDKAASLVGPSASA